MENQNDASNWFKYWFNTSYYHLLYGERDYTEANAFIDRLVAHLNLDKSSKILDLACGKGRHALALKKSFRDVIGTDISENSILEARKNDVPGLKFYTHDMRMPFYSNYFDLITNLFTSYGYFEKDSDNYRAIRNVNISLKEGGVFVMDFLNANKVVENLVARESKTIEGITFNIEREFDGTFIKKHITFRDKGESFRYTERVQGIMMDDFKKYFESANLRILETFGSYMLEPFNEKESDRLIIIAKKS
jgi:ubiquinone/menaquinone biosynthesis C-methylase UbiE